MEMKEFLATNLESLLIVFDPRWDRFDRGDYIRSAREKLGEIFAVWDLDSQELRGRIREMEAAADPAGQALDEARRMAYEECDRIIGPARRKRDAAISRAKYHLYRKEDEPKLNDLIKEAEDRFQAIYSQAIVIQRGKLRVPEQAYAARKAEAKRPNKRGKRMEEEAERHIAFAQEMLSVYGEVEGALDTVVAASGNVWSARDALGDCRYRAEIEPDPRSKDWIAEAEDWVREAEEEEEKAQRDLGAAWARFLETVALALGKEVTP